MSLKTEWIIISNPASIQILAALLDNIMDEIQEKMVEQIKKIIESIVNNNCIDVERSDYNWHEYIALIVDMKQHE